MTLDFIEKRIKEQNEYIPQMWDVYLSGNITLDRYVLIAMSAYRQYEYFESEKQKLIATSK